MSTQEDKSRKRYWKATTSIPVYSYWEVSKIALSMIPPTTCPVCHVSLPRSLRYLQLPALWFPQSLALAGRNMHTLHMLLSYVGHYLLMLFDEVCALLSSKILELFYFFCVPVQATRGEGWTREKGGSRIEKRNRKSWWEMNDKKRI